MTPRQIQLAALREQYRRHFELYAHEQLWIQTKKAGVIENLDITKKPLQRMVVELAQEQFKRLGYVDGNIIKGRQQGSSTITQALQFWKAANNRNYNTLLIAQDDPTTKAIFEKARFFYEHLHNLVKPAIRHSNRREIVFAAAEHKKQVADHGLGSRMDFQAATNMMAGTGTTRQGLHLSECAKYRQEDIDILVSSIYPAFHREAGAMRIKESTAFVGGQWFRECCDAARDGLVDEFCAFAPWYLEPDNKMPLDPKKDRDLLRMVGLDSREKGIVRTAKRGQKKDRLAPFDITPEQLKFRRVVIAQPGWDEDLFEQEYPTEFETAWITRDSRVFNHEKLYGIRKNQVRQPLRMAHIYKGPRLQDDSNMRLDPDSNYLAIWEEPIAGVAYDIGVDCAAGIEGGDYSTAIVWRREKREQVAEFHVHMDPAEFGNQLHWLGMYYYTAQVAVELTGGYGFGVEGEMKRMNYPYLSLWKHRDQAVPMPTKKTGWSTTRESKNYLVGLFRTFINRDQITIRSIVLLNEMFNFIQIAYGDGYDYRAEHGHDDLVMAAGIGLVVSDDENFGRLEEARPTEHRMVIDGDPAYTEHFDPSKPRPRNNLLIEVRCR